MRIRLLPALLLAMCLLSSVAFAQTVPGTARLAWDLPTSACVVGVDPCQSVPLTGDAALTAVEVYVSTSPIQNDSTMAPTLTLGPGATSATHTLQIANGSKLYARVRAVNLHGKSPFSNQVEKLVTLPAAPNVPTSVTLTIEITP